MSDDSTQFLPFPTYPGFKNLTGITFGRLTVQGFVGQDKWRSAMWLCLCECGKNKVTSASRLAQGTVASCGCLRRESAKRTGKKSCKHGMSYTCEYRAWKRMKTRCYDANCLEYLDYGGRGIKVCERWLKSFENFYADMGPRPSPKHSVDRFPDNDGDYGPGNCRWATPKEQARNKRSNVILECRGEKKTVAEWAELAGINPFLIHSRLRDGYDPEKAIFSPVILDGQKTLVTCDGETQSLAKWSKKTGLHWFVISTRLKRGWDVHRAIFLPLQESNSHKGPKRS